VHGARRQGAQFHRALFCDGHVGPYHPGHLRRQRDRLGRLDEPAVEQVPTHGRCHRPKPVLAAFGDLVGGWAHRRQGGGRAFQYGDLERQRVGHQLGRQPVATRACERRQIRWFVYCGQFEHGDGQVRGLVAASVWFVQCGVQEHRQGPHVLPRPATWVIGHARRPAGRHLRCHEVLAHVPEVPHDGVVGNLPGTGSDNQERSSAATTVALRRR